MDARIKSGHDERLPLLPRRRVDFLKFRNCRCQLSISAKPAPLPMAGGIERAVPSQRRGGRQWRREGSRTEGARLHCPHRHRPLPRSRLMAPPLARTAGVEIIAVRTTDLNAVIAGRPFAL